MSNKQTYREAIIEANHDSFESFCKAIDNLIELELQKEQWWDQMDQDEEYIDQECEDGYE